jgi:hypothetical protein
MSSNLSLDKLYHRLVNVRSGDRIFSTLSINEEHVSLFVVIVKTNFSLLLSLIETALTIVSFLLTFITNLEKKNKFTTTSSITYAIFT